MKIYKAKRTGFISYLLVGFLFLPVAVFLLDTKTISTKPFILLPLTIPLALILWIYLDTHYKIEDDFLYYRSAMFRGKIQIETITLIEKEKTSWTGLRPAMARKGMVIKYNRYDEIYISPESNEELITDLVTINPKIKVIDMAAIAK